MNQISETFLLTIAQASATLLGLLMVAAFSYVETGLQRVSTHVPEARSYLRSNNEGHRRAVWLRLAIAFSLVMLNPPWARLVYAL